VLNVNQGVLDVPQVAIIIAKAVMLLRITFK
jgi:hypothetical protein